MKKILIILLVTVFCSCNRSDNAPKCQTPYNIIISHSALNSVPYDCCSEIGYAVISFYNTTNDTLWQSIDVENNNPIGEYFYPDSINYLMVLAGKKVSFSFYINEASGALVMTDTLTAESCSYEYVDI